MDFELNDTERTLAETARRLVAREVEPVLAKHPPEAPSAARSPYKEYASRAAVGRRLASGPFCAACGLSGSLLAV